MIEIDLFTCQSSERNEYVKILGKKYQTISFDQCEMLELRGSEISAAPLPERREQIPPGLYMVPHGHVYGALYVEIDGLLLREPDLIPEYILAQIDNGTIDIGKVRDSRKNIRFVDEPCVVLNSTSHWVYGHWILDILPRAWIAKQILGNAFNSYYMLVPNDSPSSMIEVLCRLLDIDRDRICYFDADHELISTKAVCIPSLLHNSYCPNPSFSGFVDSLKAAYSVDPQPHDRKIFISRSRFRGRSRSVRRSISDEGEIEKAFASAGYDIVYPETLTFHDQIVLFSQCSVIAGEAGSALHNSIFAAPGTVIISLASINDVQPKLAEFSGQHLITIIPEKISSNEGTELHHFQLEAITAALIAADRLERQSLKAPSFVTMP